MSLSVLVLDFWAGVSDYLQRSTLSSLRARSVPASYPAERGALALSVCFSRVALFGHPRADALRLDAGAQRLVTSFQSACSVPYRVLTRNLSVSASPSDALGNRSWSW